MTDARPVLSLALSRSGASDMRSEKREVLLTCNDGTSLGPVGCTERSTSQVKKDSGSHPRVRVKSGGSGVVSQAGGVLLTETARSVGLTRALSSALAPWRRSRAVHDRGRRSWISR
jgi:hypothetical protein